MEKTKKKMPKALKIILLIVGIFLLVNLIAALPVASFIEVQVLKGKGDSERTREANMKAWLDEETSMDADEFEKTYQMTSLNLPSSENIGYVIPVFHFIPEAEAKGFVVMAHGMNSSHIGIYPEAELFLEEGYEVFSFDERKFGESTWEYTSYGYYEGKDVEDVFQYACDSSPEYYIKGIWGQSLGGAACEDALDNDGLREKLDFVVLDCPMGAMDELTGAPAIQNKLAGKFNKSIVGYSFDEQNPYGKLKQNTAPVLLLLAKEDKVIPEISLNKIRESVEASPAELSVYESEGSPHADIVYVDRDGYKEILDYFLKALE